MQGQIAEDTKQNQLAKEESYRMLERYLDIKHREAAIKDALKFAKQDSDYLWFWLQSYLSRKVEPTEINILLALSALSRNYKDSQLISGAGPEGGDAFIVQAITLLVEANKTNQGRIGQNRF